MQLRRNQRTRRRAVGISLHGAVRARLQRFRRMLIPRIRTAEQTACMLKGDDTPANDPAEDAGRRVAGRAPAARSTAYVNGRATRNALRRVGSKSERPLQAAEDFPIGAHLLTPRRGYTHHGIYVGNGRVVHYAGLHRAWSRGPVEEVSLAEFADGQAVLLKIGAAAIYPDAAIVERARSRLGENRYRLTTNNCEHFCEWCLRGHSHSEQVDRWLALPRKFATGLMARAKQALAARGVRAGIGAA